jgi:hypothetical protein
MGGLSDGTLRVGNVGREPKGLPGRSHERQERQEIGSRGSSVTDRQGRWRQVNAISVR